MKFRFSPLQITVALWLFAGSCFSHPLVTPDGSERFPPVKLRAYGTVSGERTLIPGSSQSSVLTIRCESEPKAQLLLAKYLSDLGLLPGVRPMPLTTAHGVLAAREVEGQGVVAAARCGQVVYIFTAADSAALKALYESTLASDAKINATEAEIPVPMYLDRWDKHGFRFYYAPFVKPGHTENHEIRGPYDPTQDFAFAHQAGDVGLVVWNIPARDGVMDLNSREWVFDAAKRLN